MTRHCDMLGGMSERPEKDSLDLGIDFFLGAIVGGPVAGWLYFKLDAAYFSGFTLTVVIATWGAMAGALCAMYRGPFWSVMGTCFFAVWDTMLNSQYNSGMPGLQLPDRVTWRAYLLFWTIFLVALLALILYTVYSASH